MQKVQTYCIHQSKVYALKTKYIITTLEQMLTTQVVNNQCPLFILKADLPQLNVTGC